ncbi:MAG: acyltransferase [Bacteroidetes bacterium]|jgi:predicted amidohydrolase|nr:acyltransferase [Bacteroidota bacterium]
MKIAYLQFTPSYLDVTGNLDRAGELLAGADADLIVLPELFTSGYHFRSTQDLADVAEPIPGGPATDRLAAWADATDATFVAGIAERSDDAFYNSAVVVSPNGYEGTYRKVHLYYKEKTLFAPGDDGFSVYELTARNGTSYTLGVMVCFDWYFPEAARSLALQGADIIAHPSNLVRPDCPRAMPIRALENHIFTITANRAGSETSNGETLTFIGQSEICDPDGHILIRADHTGDHFETVKIDPVAARDRQITAHNHIFQDRRPEWYAL